jgi:hypothetical protein
MSEESRLERLKSKIRDVFAEAKYPGDDQILYDRNHCPECQQVATDFQGQPWPQVSLKILRFNRENFGSQFTPAGFRFYLPAYLLAALEDGDVLEYTLFALLPLDKPDAVARWQEKIQGLSVEQRGVVREFLDYIKEERPAQFLPGYPDSKLAFYWSDAKDQTL